MISQDELQVLLDDYAACEAGEFSLPVLAFTVARKMVEAQEIGVLEHLPEKLRAGVLNIARVYRRDGEVISQSSNGTAVHNDLGLGLSSLLDAELGKHWY